MELYDWLLFLHVLSAFLVVGSLAALWALALGTRMAMLDTTSTATSSGTAGSSLRSHSGLFGGWAGKRFEESPVGGRRAGIRLQALNSVAVLAILVLMI